MTPVNDQIPAKMKKNLIETYPIDSPGYDPFLIREGWQVARLTHIPEQDLFGIRKMDKHLLTDELFILLKGTAVLIAASEEDANFQFEFVRMEPGIPYNIPVGQWHNIAMDREAELIIVEKDKTHLGDYEYRPLRAHQIDQVKQYMSSLTGMNGTSHATL
jgi:hypothetical protein